MPELTMEESIEVTSVYSVLGMLEKNRLLIKKAPFRSVYPDVTKAGLIGGGSRPVPGEISLSHKGILFLDELAEFDRNVMQSMRAPLENGKILISRCGEFMEFPGDFMLVAASNPCKCGKMLEGGNKCVCTPIQARQYLSRISKPLLDRIDLHVPVRRVILDSNIERSETSRDIKKRVLAAREIQRIRFLNENFKLNGKMHGKSVYRYCKISSSCEKLLKNAANDIGSSMRGYEKVLKIARTIADLAHRKNIDECDIAEALQYRFLDSCFQEAV